MLIFIASLLNRRDSNLECANISTNEFTVNKEYRVNSKTYTLQSMEARDAYGYDELTLKFQNHE